jgi:hypothetical protein
MLVAQSLDTQEEEYWVWFWMQVWDESVAALVVVQIPLRSQHRKLLQKQGRRHVLDLSFLYWRC